MRRGLVVLLLVAAGCGGQPAARPQPARTSLPPVLTGVAGTVVVTDLDAVRLTPDGTHCVTRGRYADIAEGARVLLSGPRRNLAAVTQLGSGRLLDGRGNRPPGCTFLFSTENVPNRHPDFVVRVGDQRPVHVDPYDLVSGTDVLRFPR